MWFILVLINIQIIASQEDQHAFLLRAMSEFQNEYTSSNVFIAQGEAFDDLRASNGLVTLLREFSEKRVFTMVARITDIPKEIHYCQSSKNRVLLVVILESVTDFHTFSKITRSTDDLHLNRILLLFSKNISKFCHRPIGNPFNLIFNSKMLVKCEDSDIIQEWYSIHNNVTKTIDLFKWNFDGFVKLTSLGFYERRNSLEGLRLKVTTEEGFNFTGIFGSSLIEISKAANFKIQVQSYEKGLGTYNPDTQIWSGLMGRLQKKQTDIGITLFGLTMTPGRLNSVDFSQPILISKTGFYSKKLKKTRLTWSMYYNAFGVKAAYCLLVILIGSPIILTTIVVIRQEQINYKEILYDYFLYVWRIFCINSSPEISKNISTRIVCLSLLITAFILYSTYSTLLVSYLTVFKPDMPFSSLEEFMNAKTHKILTFKNTNLIESFKYSTDPIMKRLNKFIVDEAHMPNSVAELSKQVCDSVQNKVLYAEDLNIMSSQIIYPCELIPFATGMLNNKCLGFAKGSPYMGLINFYLLKMQNTGILTALLNRNLKNPGPGPTGYKSMTLMTSLPLFGVLGAGISLAVLVLFCEKFTSSAIFQQLETRLRTFINKTKFFTHQMKLLVINRYRQN